MTPRDELREWLNGPEAHEVAVRASGYGSARGSKIREIGDHLVGKILPALAEADGLRRAPSAGDELRAKVHQLIGAGWALAKLVDDDAAVAAHAGLAAEVDALLERPAGDETPEPNLLTPADRHALEAMPITFDDGLMVPVEHRALGPVVEVCRDRGWCEVTDAGWDLTDAGRVVLADARKDRAGMERQVAGALRSTISAHGPVGANEVGSASKRIVGQLVAFLADRPPRLGSHRKEKAMVPDQKPTPDARAIWVTFYEDGRPARAFLERPDPLPCWASLAMRYELPSPVSPSLPGSGERVRLTGRLVDAQDRLIDLLTKTPDGWLKRRELDGQRDLARRDVVELRATLATLPAPSPGSGEREGLEARRLIEARPTEAYSASDATANDYEAMLEYANALEDHLRAGLGEPVPSSPPAGGEAVGQVERAHELLDEAGIPREALAVRVGLLVDGTAPNPARPAGGEGDDGPLSPLDRLLVGVGALDEQLVVYDRAGRTRAAELRAVHDAAREVITLAHRAAAVSSTGEGDGGALTPNDARLLLLALFQTDPTGEGYPDPELNAAVERLRALRRREPAAGEGDAPARKDAAVLDESEWRGPWWAVRMATGDAWAWTESDALALAIEGAGGQVRAFVPASPVPAHEDGGDDA